MVAAWNLPSILLALSTWQPSPRTYTLIPQGGVTGYKSVGQSTDALMSAIQNGSVSVAIEADQMAFQLYSGGILSSGCGTNLDHGVLQVDAPPRRARVQG